MSGSAHHAVPEPGEAYRSITDPDVVRDVYLRDPLVHPYGLADVSLYWHRSRWWTHTDDPAALVGVLDLPGSPDAVVYAVSVTAPEATRRLLAALAADGRLGDRFVITGPRGLAGALAASHRPQWTRDYVKLACLAPERLPAADPRVRPLDARHLDRVARLFATDPAAGDFFHPGLLDDGWYRAIAGPDGELQAVAGTHVVDPHTGAAAIGNVATHPAARRLGLARATVGTLTRELLAGGSAVGLNVTVTNHAARALYDTIGFVAVHDYEEAELVALSRPTARDQI